MSEVFDAGARELLERAYAARGGWVSTRLANPGPRHIAYFAAAGINVLGADNASTASGAHRDYRSRWGRAFARSVFYLNRWYFTSRGTSRGARRMVPNTRPVEIEIGRMRPVLGIIPAGREVRIRVHPGGQAALRAAQREPAAARIYTADGNPGPRWSDAAGRDW